MPISDQGISLDRYMLIPRVLIFIKCKSRFLLLKGAEYKRLWSNLYNGIGGHVEAGEDILSAARRELKEETGLTTTLRLCGTVMVETETNPGIGMYVFYGEATQEETGASNEGVLEWHTVEEVMSLPTVEDVPALIERIEKMKPGDPPFNARSFYTNERLTIVFSE